MRKCLCVGEAGAFVAFSVNGLNLMGLHLFFSQESYKKKVASIHFRALNSEEKDNV